MYDMDEEQTLLQTPLLDTDQVRQSINTTEPRDNLNLYKVRMIPLHFSL